VHAHAHCMCKADWRAEESELQMGSQRMNVCMYVLEGITPLDFSGRWCDEAVYVLLEY
jgi:hypothetical protein